MVRTLNQQCESFSSISPFLFPRKTCVNLLLWKFVETDHSIIVYPSPSLPFSIRLSLTISFLPYLPCQLDSSYFNYSALFLSQSPNSVLSLSSISLHGGVRPPSPPRHDTTAPEEPTPARVQPPRQAKTKDAEFHYTK